MPWVGFLNKSFPADDTFFCLDQVDQSKPDVEPAYTVSFLLKAQAPLNRVVSFTFSEGASFAVALQSSLVVSDLLVQISSLLRHKSISWNKDQ